jgi:hypothetical protein
MMDIKDEIELISFIKNEVVNRQGTLFNLYISGSDLYGWRSKDSDLDIRGCFQLDKEVFLGLSNPKLTLQLRNWKENYDIDLFELKHMINLAVKGNCNKLEEINAPQLYKTSDFLKLQQMINNTFGKKGLYDSYKGMATFNYKKFILQGRNTVKKYLYVFRALMAGSYALENGQIQPNMERLITHYRTPDVKQLLKIKQAGLENEPLHDIDNGALDKSIKKWFDHIDNAYLKSKIPEYPDKKDIKKIEQFLVDLRMRS